MACCAFAVFLLSQLLLPLRYLRVFFFGEPEARANAAAAWTPASLAPVKARRRVSLTGSLAVAVCIDLLLMTAAVSAGAFSAGKLPQELILIQGLHKSICHGLGLAN